MKYIKKYESPFGSILILACDDGLLGLWFYGQKYFAAGMGDDAVVGENEHIRDTIKWLDIYFDGKIPDFTPRICLNGTDFQKEVWELLLTIPYGQYVTYGHIAKELAKKHGQKTMSAQAVGGAVGHNKISIIVPCHRVLGAGKKLTGYAGGIDKKKSLLELENLYLF